MSDARVLAELMGFGPRSRYDLNAMREVWKVLTERGLWDSFLVIYGHTAKSPFTGDFSFDDDGDVVIYGGSLYHFLNDLPGQVKAAIKVLKEVQG